jgi:hypothetical protein
MVWNFVRRIIFHKRGARESHGANCRAKISPELTRCSLPQFTIFNVMNGEAACSQPKLIYVSVTYLHPCSYWQRVYLLSHLRSLAASVLSHNAKIWNSWNFISMSFHASVVLVLGTEITLSMIWIKVIVMLSVCRHTDCDTCHAKRVMLTLVQRRRTSSMSGARFTYKFTLPIRNGAWGTR